MIEENDPRSFYYVRKLNRPKINWRKIACFSLIIVLLATLFFFVIKYIFASTVIGLLSAMAFLIICVAVMRKKIVICLIHIYQRYASDRIRNKCRFEPSCSEYMIIAVEKYGFFRGIKKGIHRLLRCNENNGGFDYP